MTGNQAKYLSYREAWERINAAIESKFYFEAVSIAESILSDRLLSFIAGVDPNSKVNTRTSFAQLIEAWRRLAGSLPSHPPYEDIGEAVNEWRKDRNSVVHGLVKSYPGTPTEDFGSFLQRAEKTAKEGKSLARKVSGWHKEELRRARA